MIRTPELKKQAAMLALEVQAATHAPLQHAAALEIVAKLHGFKNWRHAVSAGTSEPVAAPVPVVPPTAPVELAVVFGSEDMVALENGADPQSLDTYDVRTFGSESERTAYIQGLADMEGWMGYQIVDDSFKQFLAEFAPGEDAEVIRAELTKMGFRKVPSNMRGAYEEFNRDICGGEALGYQFIIFQSDDITGARYVNMDCALNSSGDYLTETPLFTGNTVLETLRSALKVADIQAEEAYKEALTPSE